MIFLFAIAAVGMWSVGLGLVLHAPFLIGLGVGLVVVSSVIALGSRA